jgi:hypothetical protein
MADATKEFEELPGCLKRHGARFVIVGAHAVACHAKPRYEFAPHAARPGRVVSMTFAIALRNSWRSIGFET